MIRHVSAFPRFLPPRTPIRGPELTLSLSKGPTRTALACGPWSPDRRCAPSGVTRKGLARVRKCHDSSCSVAESSSVAHERPGLKIETDRSIFRVFFHRQAAFPARKRQKSAIFVLAAVRKKNLLWIISQAAHAGRPRGCSGAAPAPERWLPAGVMKCHGPPRCTPIRPPFRPLPLPDVRKCHDPPRSRRSGPAGRGQVCSYNVLFRPVKRFLRTGATRPSHKPGGST